MTEDINNINVGKALDYIRINAPIYAEAKATRVYLEQYRKSQKALLFNKCEDGTVQAKESWAYAQTEYLVLLENYREAVKQEEYQKWMMTAAQLKIEVYRTQQANNRFIDKSHT